MISNLEKNLEWIEEQGMLKGIEQGIETAALNMLREGIEVPLIIKVTGLPEAKIEELKKRIH